MNLTDHEFTLLRQCLLHLSGIEIPVEKRYLFTTRLDDLVMHEKCASFSDLFKKLTAKEGDVCRRHFVESMTTHESGFFRDGHPFQAFLEVALPAIAGRKVGQAHYLSPRLRILSVGSSFGQEPYSIAICVREWLVNQSVFQLQNISIMGIDISHQAIERAKKCVYSKLELGKHLPPKYRENYFVKQGDRWAVSEEIRKMVIFEERNITSSLGDLGKFDIVFCRNVIIYFPLEMRKNVIGKLHGLLEPEGALFLGSAESLFNVSDEFMSRNIGETVYYTALPADSTLEKHDEPRSGL